MVRKLAPGARNLSLIRPIDYEGRRMPTSHLITTFLFSQLGEHQGGDQLQQRGTEGQRGLRQETGQESYKLCYRGGT